MCLQKVREAKILFSFTYSIMFGNIASSKNAVQYRICFLGATVGTLATP